MPVVDQSTGTGLACDPLDALNSLAVRGNIALVDRGACDFVTKARNVQAAGALGMVVADNQPGDVTGMSGTDASITIPSVRITQGDGIRLKAALQRRSRTQSGVVASLPSETGMPKRSRSRGKNSKMRSSSSRAARILCSSSSRSGAIASRATPRVLRPQPHRRAAARRARIPSRAPSSSSRRLVLQLHLGHGRQRRPAEDDAAFSARLAAELEQAIDGIALASARAPNNPLPAK